MTECRHAFDCDGWTIDPRTSVCWACGAQFFFWSEPDNISKWETDAARAAKAAMEGET